MLTKIYVQPIDTFITYTVISLLVWIGVGIVLLCIKENIWRFLNLVLMVLGLVFLIYCTLLSRQEGDRTFELIPLASFQKAKINPEYYRTMLLNTILFMPFGFGLAGWLPLKESLIRRTKIVLTAVFVVSLSVETVQYIFRLGVFETDDLMANVTGGVIAAIAMGIVCAGAHLLNIINNNKAEDKMDKHT